MRGRVKLFDDVIAFFEGPLFERLTAGMNAFACVETGALVGASVEVELVCVVVDAGVMLM